MVSQRVVAGLLVLAAISTGLVLWWSAEPVVPPVPPEPVKPSAPVAVVVDTRTHGDARIVVLRRDPPDGAGDPKFDTRTYTLSYERGEVAVQLHEFISSRGPPDKELAVAGRKEFEILDELVTAERLVVLLNQNYGVYLTTFDLTGGVKRTGWVKVSTSGISTIFGEAKILDDANGLRVQLTRPQNQRTDVYAITQGPDGLQSRKEPDRE